MAYCTPLMIEIDGRDAIGLRWAATRSWRHDPATGEELWWFTYSGYSNVSRPVLRQGQLFFSSGFGKPIFYAIKLGGRGDMTETNKLWTVTKGAVVPLDVSPLVVGNELYTISDAGIAVCYDAATGKQHWQQRLASKFWASPVYADGRIYCLDDTATTTVLAPGQEFEKLATNKLDGRRKPRQRLSMARSSCAPTNFCTASKSS